MVLGSPYDSRSGHSIEGWGAESKEGATKCINTITISSENIENDYDIKCWLMISLGSWYLVFLPSVLTLLPLGRTETAGLHIAGLFSIKMTKEKNCGIRVCPVCFLDWCAVHSSGQSFKPKARLNMPNFFFFPVRLE